MPTMTHTAKRRARRDTSWTKGFLAGQITTYCEAILRGTRLVAQVAFQEEHSQLVMDLVKQEGCKATTAQVGPGRLSVWIYRDDAVIDLVNQLRSTPQSKLAMWNMGKLFGYADGEVIDYVRSAR